MTIFITNVYSTGYGIGTVFPFVYLNLKCFILPMGKTLNFYGFRLKLRTD